MIARCLPLPTLDSLGFNPFFSEQLETYKSTISATTPDVPLIPARVVVEYQDRYRIITADGYGFAQLSGNLLREATADRLRRPAVGDWVLVRTDDGQAYPAADSSAADALAVGTIVHLCDRRTRFVRQAAGRRTSAQVVAANVDTVFVVTSFNRDFNPRRIERFLTTVWDSGARPVIVVNKLDLTEDPGPQLAELEAVAPGVPAAMVSAKQRIGEAELRAHIADGETVALVGSSGVGKSTLINWLVGRDVQEVAEIRSSDAKGRHTTTHRELIPMPGGGLLIDTPGMRELQLWTVGAGVDDTFGDVAGLAENCRFRDCGHQREPGCAIREAVAAGELDEDRVESYFKLQRELVHAERRQDESAAITERRKWKQIMKDNRVRKRITGK